MKFENTPRGFAIAKFSDLYGAGCSIQKSSVATDDAIWIGIVDAEPQIMATQAAQLGVKTEETTGWVPYPVPCQVSLTTRMHLNREQVDALIPVLQRFVDTGDLS